MVHTNFVSIVVCCYKGVCAGQYAYASLREHVPGLHLLQEVNVCIVAGECACLLGGVCMCFKGASTVSNGS